MADPVAPTSPASFVDQETGLTATQHDGRVWFKSGGKYFSAGSVGEGLDHDPLAALATPEEVSHKLAVREQDTLGGQAKIAAKEVTSHAFDAATGIVRYPFMAGAALLDSEKGLKAAQDLSGQSLFQNLYGIYKEVAGEGNQEEAGRQYQAATVAQTEANPTTGLVAGVVGDIVPMVATAGLSSAGAVTGKLASERLAEAATRRLGEGALRKAGESAFANAIQGVGFGMQAASEQAYLADEPLTRQKVWAAGAMGGVFGGVIGGGTSLIGSGVGAARRGIGNLITKAPDAAPRGSIAEKMVETGVSKESAEAAAAKFVADEGVPAAPGLGEKIHSLLTDIQARSTGADKEAIRKFGPGALLDPKSRAEAVSGWEMLANREQIMEKASGEVAESLSQMEKHASDGAFQQVRDLGMKRQAWERLVDPTKRGEQIDAARAFIRDTRAQLEEMAAKAKPVDGIEVNVGAFDQGSMRPASLEYLRANPEGADRLGKPRIDIYPDSVSVGDGRHRMQLAHEAGESSIRANVVRYDGEGNVLSEALEDIGLTSSPSKNWREAARVVQREAPEDLERLAYGDIGRINSALGHAKRAEVALERDVSGAEAAIELDGFKRQLGKVTKLSKKRWEDLQTRGDFGAEAQENTLRVLSGTYEKVRQNLADSNLWGKAGEAQTEINKGWQDWIDSRKLYRSTLLRDTGQQGGGGEFGMWQTRGRYEVDPDKVGSWIDKFGTGRGKLNDDYIRAHITATDNLTKSIGKYVDSGELGNQVAAVRAATDRIKSNLEMAQKTVAVTNQVALVGGAQMGGVAKAGMAAAGMLAGGPVGAALGYMLSPGKIMQAAMAIQGLASKVDVEKKAAMDSFFSSAARKVGSAAKGAETAGEYTAHTAAVNASGALDSAKVSKRAATSAASRMFGGATPQARAESYQKKREQLAMLTSNPQLMMEQTNAVLGSLPAVAPKFATSLALDISRNLMMLQQMAPPAVAVGGMFAGKRQTFTPQQDVEKFAAQWDGVMNPMSVLKDLASGSLNIDKVTAAREAHPELFQEMAVEFLERSSQLSDPMNPQAALQADLFLGLNGLGEPSVEPGFLARIDSLNQYQADQQQAGPSPRPPVNMAKGTRTLSQSLEGV